MSPTAYPGLAETSQGPGYAVVLGDVIGSRQTRDPHFRTSLRQALRETGERTAPLQAPQITVGDEFQAVYRCLGDALRATMVANLLLANRDIEARFGVGWGRLFAWDSGREPFGQDGPAWWVAREALVAVKASEGQHRRPPQLHTMVRVETQAPPVAASRPAPAYEALPLPGFDTAPPPGATLRLDVEPLLQALVCGRDTITARFDRNDRLLMLAMDAGASLRDAAAQAGISEQAGSERARRNGIYALLQLDAWLTSAFAAPER